MIKNDRQYRITKAAAEKFRHSIDEMESHKDSTPSDIDPVIERAQLDALKSQLHELQVQLREYEELSAGKVGVLELRSLADLPIALVQARIAEGLSQKDLADRLGLKEQQVQRYEATNYQRASLSRLLEIADALGIHVRKELLLPTASRTTDSLFKRLSGLGFSKDFVLSRLVPKEVVTTAASGEKKDDSRLLFAATNAITHIFGWTPAAVLGESQPWFNAGVLGATRFKVSENTEQKSLEVYTFYAHYLALLLLQATQHLPIQPVPTDPDEVYDAIMDRYGGMTFYNALLYTWDLGIPVLPLDDRGAFHGACWRVEGRNVIVLKQRTSSHARWLFDLLHELRHAGESPESPIHSVIEEPETSPQRRDSEDEKVASWFAGEASLGGQAEALAERCVDRAQGSIERLKSVVRKVASEARVDTASLANYIAFRLSLQGENWWGTAMNLQPRDENPWSVARNVLLARSDLTQLRGMDSMLFTQALRESKD